MTPPPAQAPGASADGAVPPSLPALRAWLLQGAIPLWLTHGIDRTSGGFHEALAPFSDKAGTYFCDAPFRRLRVLTRQIHVFSLAASRHVPGAAEAAAHGIDILIRHAALPDGGYANRFDLQNRAVDTTLDLYDHAFVLLALASATAVLPAPPLRRRARALLDLLDRDFAHPAGGYQESLPPVLPRRQNPHMHLLEALLAAHAAFADPIFLDRATALVTLFLTRLHDPATGALPEYFSDALAPERDAGLFAVEPGHHCEWAWLLHEYRAALHAFPEPTAQRAAAPSPGALAQASAALLAFTDRHGSHPQTGDLVDHVASDGRQTARTARLWPQTERLKSAYLRPDTTTTGRTAAVTSLAAWLRPDGLWHERRTAEGAFIPGPSPASSLYHLATAILVVAPGTQG